MAIYSKIKYKDKNAKLEVFGKNHKLAKSLPVHEHALAAGLCVPKIYEIKEKSGRIYKYTEWVDGNTILHEMENNESLIQPICNDLGRYVNMLYNIDGITAVDSHFKNFVWNKKGVVYIDMKKLLYRKPIKEHILQMTKICLKSCRGDKRKVLAFLRGYSEYRNIEPIVEECDRRNWRWLGMGDQILHTGQIKLKDI